MNDVMKRAAAYLQEKIGVTPEIGIILGSGLGNLAEKIEDKVVVPYKEIEGMRVSTAPGHIGQFVVGKLGGKTVICMQGRIHFYEGYSMMDLAYPIRLMKLVGIKTLIVTNASGAINPTFVPGEICLITDHMNFMGTNPLIGPNDDDFGPRFPDMSEPYDAALRAIAVEVAKEKGIPLAQGVYLALTGPSFETPAEIRAFGRLGADVVGMSTVPEVIFANHCGMKVLGFSLPTCMASGVSDEPLDEQAVIDTAEAAIPVMESLVVGCIEKM